MAAGSGHCGESVTAERVPFRSSHRFCVAPMLDVSDRHFRFFARVLSRRARLYTEMIVAQALLQHSGGRLLAFAESEHPVALQLGGSEPQWLARAARMGERAGFDEINLNCGCPSPRVQQGAFGAALMRQPAQVAECVRAMRAAVTVPVTVKHRIGIDREASYGFVRDFVGTVAEAGCEVFIVHARNAWLDGLDPKENRTIPPLRYPVVARLAADFPQLTFVLNGGLRRHVDALDWLDRLDGAMIGREAADHPWMLSEVDWRYFGSPAPCTTRDDAIDAMRPYLQAELAKGTAPASVVRHLLGLFNGLPGARRWRRALSDQTFLARHGAAVLEQARSLMKAASRVPENDRSFAGTGTPATRSP